MLTGVRQWLRECGAAESVAADCLKLAAKARALLNTFPPNGYRDNLLEFTDYLTARER